MILVMISPNEIRNRATSFAKEWMLETREDVEATKKRFPFCSIYIKSIQLI